MVGKLTVSDAIRSQTIFLSCIGLRAPAIQVIPSEIAFSPEQIGQASVAVPLTITNAGGIAINDIGFQITGPGASSFSWAVSTCGASLSAGANCTVQVGFKPESLDHLAATLTISSSTLGVIPVQVPLFGTGQRSSGLSISPSQMTFTQLELGKASIAQNATVTNTTTAVAGELSVSASTPFSVAQNSCGSSLQPGASCVVSVTFAPTSNGVLSGTLTVSSSTFSNPAFATLVGIGGATGSVQSQPGSITFPSTGVGPSSEGRILTLTNNGPVVLSGLGISVSSGFSIASSTCASSLRAAGWLHGPDCLLSNQCRTAIRESKYHKRDTFDAFAGASVGFRIRLPCIDHRLSHQDCVERTDCKLQFRHNSLERVQWDVHFLLQVTSSAFIL